METPLATPAKYAVTGAVRPTALSVRVSPTTPAAAAWPVPGSTIGTVLTTVSEGAADAVPIPTPRTVVMEAKTDKAAAMATLRSTDERMPRD